MYDWLLYGGIFALGYLTKCVVNFIDDWREYRYTLRSIGATDTQPSIGSPADEIPASSPTGPRPRRLIRTEGAPEGYSAKQVIGYYRGGSRWVGPQFPGGLEAWDRRADGTVA